MANLYDEFEMNMNGTPVKFTAWQAKKEDVCGLFTVKYQTPLEGGMDWGELNYPCIRLSLGQWQHFQHDINPAKPLHYYLRTTSQVEVSWLPVAIEAVITGQAIHLGRGNSWNGYRFGDQVVKLSSIVPYVWQNTHAYLTVAESFAQGVKEVNINKALLTEPKMQGRIAPILRIDNVGQKIAVTMPYLQPVAEHELTSDQAYYLEETIHRLHRLGWAYLDQEIGFGLNESGTPLIYDLSTVRHRSELNHLPNWRNWIEDDLNVIDRLREKHGLSRSSTSQLRADLRKKRHDKIMEMINATKNA
jgi:hypothetical protein